MFQISHVEMKKNVLVRASQIIVVLCMASHALAGDSDFACVLVGDPNREAPLKSGYSKLPSILGLKISNEELFFTEIPVADLKYVKSDNGFYFPRVLSSLSSGSFVSHMGKANVPKYGIVDAFFKVRLVPDKDSLDHYTINLSIKTDIGSSPYNHPGVNASYSCKTGPEKSITNILACSSPRITESHFPAIFKIILKGPVWNIQDFDFVPDNGWKSSYGGKLGTAEYRNATSKRTYRVELSDDRATADVIMDDEAGRRGGPKAATWTDFLKYNCTSDSRPLIVQNVPRGNQKEAVGDTRVTKIQDAQHPTIEIGNASSDGARGNISGTVTDDTGIVEVLIDGEVVDFDQSGRFSFSTFIPVGGKNVIITAFDTKGLSTTETVRLEREALNQVAKLSFDELNPTTRRVKANGNALALIIGVSEYSLTAPAEFADRDAQVFYDYANLKLGIPQDRIQTLINDKADEVGLLSGINKWLKRSVKQGESDVYIFFAGHGLASDDGDTAYLIPYDGAPDFLERTAISRDEVFREVSSVNPRSVTVFLDTCYSGDTRGETRLIAGRPLSIKLQEQSLPKGFTVLTAAGGDQIAKPLKEAQHGMFSYFLMKGMEGDADSNSDNQITARELHTYVRENVVQQSGGSQVPELQGDAERVLVRFR